MTSTELIRSQLDGAHYMLTKVYEGIDDRELDLRLSVKAMTAREIAAHLDECYQCVVVESAGGKHEWGSHQPSTMEWPGLYNEMMARREAAVAASLAGDDAGLQRAIAYIISHDNYHIGQLCLIRLEGNENWDAYSIYNM